MNKNSIESIKITWEGPFSLEDIEERKEINDKNIDYGVYQIYGCHPIYGNDVLLYIGKACKQTFAKRILQEGWEYNADAYNIKCYVGRLFEEKRISTDKWEKMIDISERMLIYAHEPASNSSNIKNISKDKEILKEFENVRIFNYDNHRSLMPEISGELWIKKVDFSGVIGSENNKVKDK